MPSDALDGVSVVEVAGCAWGDGGPCPDVERAVPLPLPLTPTLLDEAMTLSLPAESSSPASCASAVVDVNAAVPPSPSPIFLEGTNF